MVSPNRRMQWAIRRLPPNQDATYHAKTAVRGTIGQKSRQDGAQPHVQERHLDHTQPPVQHQSQSWRQQQHRQQSSGQVSGPGRHSTPAANTRTTKSPQPSPGSRPHNRRQGAARGTRSSNNNEVVSAFEWEALALEKASEHSGPIFTAGIGKSQGCQLLTSCHEIVLVGPHYPGIMGWQQTKRLTCGTRFCKICEKPRRKMINRSLWLSRSQPLMRRWVKRLGVSLFSFPTFLLLQYHRMPEKPLIDFIILATMGFSPSRWLRGILLPQTMDGC